MTICSILTGGGDDRRGAEPPRRAAGGRRTDYGVIVSNLPRGCSWQDLKDFMRKAGDVVFTDVERGGDGIVEFSNRDDMEYAIKSLDDTEFKSYNDTAVIRVKAANAGKKRDRSEDERDSKGAAADTGRRASGGRDRSASRSRSPSRSRSRDRGASSGKRHASDDEEDDKKGASAGADDDDRSPVKKEADERD